jgi:hypothetical protein
VSVLFIEGTPDATKFKSDRRAQANVIQTAWRGAGIPPRVEEYKEILAPKGFNDQMHHDAAAHVWSCGLTGLAKLRALGDTDPVLLMQWTPGTPVSDLVSIFMKHRAWTTVVDGSRLPRQGDVVILGTDGLTIHVTNADQDVVLDKPGLSFTAGGHQTGPYMNIGAESRWFHMVNGRLWADSKPVLGWGDLDLLDLPWGDG